MPALLTLCKGVCIGKYCAMSHNFIVQFTIHLIVTFSVHAYTVAAKSSKYIK